VVALANVGHTDLDVHGLLLHLQKQTTDSTEQGRSKLQVNPRMTAPWHMFWGHSYILCMPDACEA
jgi:hypothetical protein